MYISISWMYEYKLDVLEQGAFLRGDFSLTLYPCSEAVNGGREDVGSKICAGMGPEKNKKGIFGTYR